MKEFLKKKLPSFLLAASMLVSIAPAANAVSADIEAVVDAGEEVEFSRSAFKSLYNSERFDSDYSFSYLEFTDYDDLDDYGYFCAKDSDGDWTTLDEDSLDDNVWFYYYPDDIDSSVDCELDKLTFVADDNADAGTLTLEFELCDENRDEIVYGTMEIEVDGSDSSDYDIIYEVEPGEKAAFSAEDFYDFFEDNYSSSSYSLRYVIFDKPASSDLADGTLYYNYSKSSEETFTRSTFSEATFYYDNASYGDYSLDKLSFVADDSFHDDVELTFRAYYSSSRYVDGTVHLTYEDSSAEDADITYKTEEDDEVTFDRDDFADLFEEKYEDLYYIRFTASSDLDDCGYLYSYAYDEDDDDTYKVSFDEDDITDGYFYYYDRDVEDDGSSYTLDDLTFVADDGTDGETVTLAFTAYGEDTSDRVQGTVAIEIGDTAEAKADIEYEGVPGKETPLDPDDFSDYFQETYSSYDFKYLVFTSAENLNSYNGYLYYDYDGSDETRFTSSSLKNATFYYDEDDVDEDDCYPLDELSFVASEYFDTAVTLEFRAYYNSSRYVNGSVVIAPAGSSGSGDTTADILYLSTSGSSVQINANDFSRLLQKSYPSSTLQYVKINGVPAAGSLYYNYYSASKYGSSARVKLTSSNCDDQNFYRSPSDTSQYALTELTYVPSGTNYCAPISFTAYGSGSRSVSGVILISISSSTVPEVYGVITKGTAVSFPAPSIAAAVVSGTSSSLYGIQLLELPDSSVGTVYVGSGTSRKATTTDIYGYSDGAWTISQLRFVPNSSFTGSVEIPYAACDTDGDPIAVGKFCLGVVSSQKKFSDVTSSTWCYKYISELGSNNIISGYADGSFKPNNTVSYGAALKLIMLAAGYDEQKPTTSNVFSGYLAKARADGIITRSNVNLSSPITRLQVAQIAAGALKLDTSNLSSVQPFNDTTDSHVQALNAAGIVEGYFSNGVSSYKPGNTLTRGQMSAIVWRMQNYVD